MWEIIKEFVWLYVRIFAKYPLAAAITTLLFVVAYFLWMKSIDQLPKEKWKHPAFILFIGWLILTPLLGLIVNVLVLFKDILVSVAGLFVYVFKAFPAAGGIVTVVLFVVYLIWKWVIKRWRLDSRGFLSHPGLILIIFWLVATPIIGLVLKWVEPNP